MKKNLLNIFKFLLFLALGIFLLYLAFKGVNTKKLLEAFMSVNYYWIVASLLIAYCSVFARAYRWNLLIEPLGYKPSLTNSYHSVMIGYLANYAFPRIGEITRCGVMNKAEKVPADKLIGTVVMERAFDVLSLGILIILIVFLKINFFGDFFAYKVFIPIYEKLASIFDFSKYIWIILIAVGLSSIVLLFTFKQKIKQIALVQKIWNAGNGFFSGIKSIFKLKRKGEFLLHTVLIWFFYILGAYCFMKSLSATSELTFTDALFIMVIGSLGMIVPVQGGIGAYHSMVVIGFALYNIPKEDSFAYAVISHESQMVMLIIGGALSFFLMSFNRKKKERSENKI